MILIGFILTIIIAVLYEIKLRKLFPILSNFSKIGKNKVHFYVARDMNGRLYIYLSKPHRGEVEFRGDVDENIFVLGSNLKSFGLNEKDYTKLKWEDEPVEVFINMENQIMTLQEKIQKKAEKYSKLAPIFLEGAKFALDNQWISVDEDLPCNNPNNIHFRFTNRVLVIDDNKNTSIAFMKKHKDNEWIWDSTDNFVCLPLITHWMPIPEPPKE